MKRSKQRTALALLLAALLLLSGCGASGMAAEDTSDASSASEADGSGYGTYDAAAEAETTTEVTSAASESRQTAADTADRQTKLIYTADLELEVLDFDSTLESLEALTEQMGGYCESSELYNYGANRTAAYTVRVPNESYRSFLDCCADWENCYLISRSENVEDVGEAYFDAENRLNTLQTKLERLQELLRQASEMEDIITIESEISDTEYEIEQYTSTLNRYDSLVDYATIRVDLTEVVDLSEDEEIGLLARLGQNLRWGAENLRDALEELLLWLAYHFFQLLLLTAAAAAVLLIVRGKRRGRRKKQSAGQEANRQDGEPPEQT